MKISVIGSEGYIGSALLPYLKGHEVQRIDAMLYDQGDGAHVCKVPLFPYENRDAILDYLTHFNPDVIVNLAALAHDPEKRLDPVLVDAFNAFMPACVAQWAVDRKKRFIAISSLSVHAGSGAYPASKRNMEAHLFRIGLSRGIDILRFGTIFGHVPGQHYRYLRPHLLLNSMILDGVLNGVINVNGWQDRPVTALHDAISLLIDMVLVDRAPGQIINRYWASAQLPEWAQVVGRACVAEGYPVRIAPMAETSKDDRSYFLPPHVNQFAERVLMDTLRAHVRYMAAHRFSLARWRKTQFKVLLTQLKEVNDGSPPSTAK